jgi:Family of unknown function (DUF6221)
MTGGWDATLSWLHAQLDSDEQWARAASEPYRHADEGSTAPESGVHWVWVAGENWDPVTPDPVAMEFIEGTDGSWSANLATVEQWPVTRDLGGGKSRGWMAPRTYADSIGEMDPSAAGHIVRHDPAAILRRVESDRRILAMYDAAQDTASHDAESEARFYLMCDVVKAMAHRFADLPGFPAVLRMDEATT